MVLKIHRPKYLASIMVVACLLITDVHAGELQALPEGLTAEFSLPDLDGRERTLSEFHGKVVLVSFWATWCIPCLMEMPTILRLEQYMKDQPFQVIGISVAEGPYQVKTKVKRLKLDFPVLLDRDKAVFNRWGGKILPTGFVIDVKGAARYMAIGQVGWDDADVVEKLKILAAEVGG